MVKSVREENKKTVEILCYILIQSHLYSLIDNMLSIIYTSQTYSVQVNSLFHVNYFLVLDTVHILVTEHKGFLNCASTHDSGHISQRVYLERL